MCSAPSTAEEPLLRAVALNPATLRPTISLAGSTRAGGWGPRRDAYTTFLVVAPQRLRDLIEDANRRLAKLPPAEAHR